MSDGQSRCEYDEPEEPVPQERLKGGDPLHTLTPLGAGHHRSHSFCFLGNVIARQAEPLPPAGGYLVDLHLLRHDFTSFISCDS